MSETQKFLEDATQQYLKGVDRACKKYGLNFEAWRLVYGGRAELNAVLVQAGFDVPVQKLPCGASHMPDWPVVGWTIPVPPGVVKKRGQVFDHLWMEWVTLPVGGHVSRRLVQRARERLAKGPVKRDIKAPRLRKLWTRHVRIEIDLKTNKEADAELRKCYRALKQ